MNTMNNTDTDIKKNNRDVFERYLTEVKNLIEKKPYHIKLKMINDIANNMPKEFCDEPFIYDFIKDFGMERTSLIEKNEKENPQKETYCVKNLLPENIKEYIDSFPILSKKTVQKLIDKINEYHFENRVNILYYFFEKPDPFFHCDELINFFMKSFSVEINYILKEKNMEDIENNKNNDIPENISEYDNTEDIQNIQDEEDEIKLSNIFNIFYTIFTYVNNNDLIFQFVNKKSKKLKIRETLYKMVDEAYEHISNINEVNPYKIWNEDDIDLLFDVANILYEDINNLDELINNTYEEGFHRPFD